MPIDHSLTYRQLRFRNIPHWIRLRNLLNIAGRELRGKDTGALKYADFGCSNGYLTNLLAKKFGFHERYGFDHALENLRMATEKYPQIGFEFLDLNEPAGFSNQFDVVTCLETL